MDVLYTAESDRIRDWQRRAAICTVFFFLRTPLYSNRSFGKKQHIENQISLFIYRNIKIAKPVFRKIRFYLMSHVASVGSKRFIYFSWKLSISWSRRMNFSNFNVERVRWSLQHEDIIDRESNAFREIAKKSNFLRETIVSLSHVGLTRAFWKIPAPFSLSLSLSLASHPCPRRTLGASMKYRTRYFLTDKP